MSKTSPGRAAGIAFGAAVMTALAQLGLASGLAVLIWRDGDVAEWAAHLAWTSWLTAVSTVVGGFLGSRIASDTAAKIAAVPAAAVGGFVVAPLVAVPAMRFAAEPLSSAPFQAAGIGAIVGMIVIAVSLASRAVAVNVAASILLTWLLAGLAAFAPVGDTGDTIRPGVWGSWRDMFGGFGEVAMTVAPPLLIGSLIIGAAAAAATVDKGGDHRVTAVSGAFGPLLLLLGYAAASQSDIGVSTQWSGIVIGGCAAVSGLLGSALVTAFRRTSQSDERGDEPVDVHLGDVNDPPPPMPSDAYAYDETVQLPAKPIDPYATDEYSDSWTEEPHVPQQRHDSAMPAAPEYGVDHDDATEQWMADLKADDSVFEERRETESEPDPEPQKKPKRKPRKKKDD